jgi:hypothetical protein
LSAAVITKLPDLLQQFDNGIFTDFSVVQLGQLACLLEQVPADKVMFYEIGDNLVTTRDDGTLIPDLVKINAFIIEKLAPPVK